MLKYPYQNSMKPIQEQDTSMCSDMGQGKSVFSPCKGDEKVMD